MQSKGGPSDVLTYHNDNARTGATLHEQILAPANVNTNQFGKLWTLDTDEKVMAEPLYASGITIPGKGQHNVVFVATERNTVYAFDAESTNILWQVSILGPGEQTVTNWQWCSFAPQIGITATPVIDRQLGPNGTIFVEGMSVDNAGHVFQRLHALDLATGQDRVTPVAITASYPGNGENSTNGMVIFDPNMYIERAAMLLLNGVVYTSWSAHCDTQPATSWVIGFDENTLARTNVLNLTPNGGLGSMWNSGAGPAADADGNVYVTLGNGDPSTSETTPTLDANGFPINKDYGGSLVKISTTNNVLSVADYFLMYNIVQENIQDLDLSSGNPLVVPDQIDAQGNPRQLVVTSGKDQAIYLADRTNMGKYNPNNNNALYQFIPNALTNGTWSMAAYFNGTLYFGPVKQPIMAFPFQNARLSTATSHSPSTFGYPGSTPSVSANGTNNGIVWAAETVGIVIDDQTASRNAVLHAYAATNLAVELYNSNQAKNGRDFFGKGNKFITPMIANGRVYVATTTGIGVFGLLQQAPNISYQPQSQTVSKDQSAAFTVSATGASPLAYQWRLNGVNITGATNTSYTIAAAQYQDAGSYSVVVANLNGTVTSVDAALTLKSCDVHVLNIYSNATGGINVTWSTTPGTAYAIERKQNLTDAQWTTLTTVTASDTNLTFVDSNPGSQRFYRLTSDCSSEPAGFIRLSAPGNSDTFLSCPFVRPIAGAGTVDSVIESTISVTQQYPNSWTSDQFVYSSGTQPETYYVRFLSGAARGPVYPITANDTATVTVDTSVNSLATVAPGDYFVIEPYWTLNSMFSNGAGVTASPTLGNRNTELLVPDVVSPGINLSASKIYFFNAGTWKQVGQGTNDHGDDILSLNSYFTVRHNVATTTTITTMGIADTSRWTIPLRLPDGSAGTQQDNSVALTRPVTLSLEASELISSGAFSASPLPGSRTDELLVFDNAAVAKNKSAAAVYYYWNNAWRRVGMGSTIVGTNQIFTPGSGVILRKSTNTIPPIWTNSASYH